MKPQVFKSPKPTLRYWGIGEGAGRGGKVRSITETVIDGKVVKVGDKVPLPKTKLDIRPNAPIDNRPSFAPGRRNNQ